MGYLAIGMVFGWMLSAIGYGPLWALLMSCTMYAGSGQYLAVGLIEQAAPLTTMIFLTFVISFRHMVYGLSLLNKLKGGGWRKLYTIFALTDETYSIVCSGDVPEGVDQNRYYLFASLFDQVYWVAGSVAGTLLGSVIPFDTTGIDFSMTALFLVVMVEQWRSSKDHTPALVGLGVSLVCLAVFGSSNFLIPSMLGITAVLTLLRGPMEKRAQKEAAHVD